MNLTEKEVEILSLRKKGLKQSEIAKKLGISQPAVSLFERSISKKINDSIETIATLKAMGVDISRYSKKYRNIKL